MQVVSTLFIGTVISFFYSWKMACVCLLSVPLIFGSLIIESFLSSKANIKTRHYIEQAAKVS